MKDNRRLWVVEVFDQEIGWEPVQSFETREEAKENLNVWARARVVQYIPKRRSK